MTCPTELTCSRFVDGALPHNESAELSMHLRSCAACSAQVQALETERDALCLAMHGAAVGGIIPPFVPRPTISRLLTWLGWMTLGIWGISVAWMSLAEAISLPGWLSWLSPDPTNLGIQLLVTTLLQATGSTAVLPLAVTTAQSLALALLALGAFGWLVRHQPGRGAAPCLVLTLCSTLMIAAPEGQAIEVRQDENRILIRADEVIDDTLIVTAEDITIDGEVTGDLIAFGETITIRGRVGGMLVAAGETVSLEGTVAHSVIGLGESVDAREAEFGSNFYGAGESITIHPGTRIGGDGLLAASELTVDGTIDRGLIGLAQNVTLLGQVSRNVKALGSHVELADSARVGGDLEAKTRDADSAVIASGAVVSGATELTTWPEQPSRYATPGFYFGQVLHLLAAFVTGLLLFRLVPALASVRFERSSEALTTAGIGTIALIATPALAMAALITLIGAPLGILAFLLWGTSLYLATLIVARYLGVLLLTKHDARPALPLLLGLALLTILTNLPLIGGPINLVVLIVGLGMIAQWLRELWAARRSHTTDTGH